MRVVGEHRPERMPAHLGARREMALEMVGVQLDKTGQEGVAVEFRARRFMELLPSPPLPIRVG